MFCDKTNGPKWQNTYICCFAFSGIIVRFSQNGSPQDCSSHCSVKFDV